MRTFVSILIGLGVSFALGAIELVTHRGEWLAVISRPIALALAALTGTRLEQEWAMVLILVAMPITLFVIGIGLGLAIDRLRASDRPA